MIENKPADPYVRARILEETVQLFHIHGLKFTMDELAKNLGMSKKTIYAVFPDKRALLYDMVDYVFDFIRDGKIQVISSSTLDTREKLRQVLTMMTEKYRSADLASLHVLREKYPAIYHHVAERLETGWDDTIALIHQGQQEGVFREFSVPLFQLMMETTLEQFFQRDVLVQHGMTYQEALDQVVDILITGIVRREPEA